MSSQREEDDMAQKRVWDQREDHYEAQRKMPTTADELAEARERIEELEATAEQVSAEFEGDCWKAMRSLLDECRFDWEGDPVTADVAYQHLHDTLQDQERRITTALGGCQRATVRAERLEDENEKLRAENERLRGVLNDLGPEGLEAATQ